MDLSILIKLLLKDNETVIIPGFGAFITVYKPAVIRENDIIPPGKEIRFFHQIKNNDGLLAMQIARSKKISYDDAFKRIERATSKIIYQLDKGETVTFGELGEFSYNENGEIQFNPFENEVSVLPAGFESISLEDVTEAPEETKVEQPVVTEPQTIIEPEKIELKTETEEILKVEEEKVQHKKAEEIKTGPEKNQQEIRNTESVQPEIKRKKKSLAWLWILPVVAAVAVALFFFINKKEPATKAETLDQSETNKTEIIQPEVVKPDSIQPSDTVTATVSQPQTTVSAEKYHLVGGGFKSEENAIKFIDQLKDKGIEGTLLGQKGKIHLVGIASFNTEEEAYIELNRRMRKDPDWKLWIYQK